MTETGPTAHDARALDRICDDIARIEAQIVAGVGDTAALQAELEGLMADLKRLVADQPAATWTGGGEDGGDNPDDLFDDVPV